MHRQTCERLPHVPVGGAIEHEATACPPRVRAPEAGCIIALPFVLVCNALPALGAHANNGAVCSLVDAFLNHKDFLPILRILGDHKNSPCCCRSLHDATARRGVNGYRLLQKHVLPGAQRGNGQGLVEVVWNADAD
jgi:hypothetical protein